MLLGSLRLIIVALLIAILFVLIRNFVGIPAGLEGYVLAALVLLYGYLAAAILGRLLIRHGTELLGPSRAARFRFLVNLLIGVIIIALALTVAGVDPTAVLLGGTFLGLVLGLAAQTVLANLFAGLAITVSRPYEVGERITLAVSTYPAIWPSYPHEQLIPGYTGTVQEIGMMYTALTDDSGVPMRIPNSIMITALLLNQSEVTTRRVRVHFPIPRSPDPRAAASAIETALRRVRSFAREPRPTVHLVDAAPTSFDAVITVWTGGADEEAAKHQILTTASAALEAREKAGPQPSP